MFGQNRDQLRRFYLNTWNKHRAGAPLQDLERLVAGVLEQHPEYHSLLREADVTARDFDEGQANPFLHMGMHIALAEQLGSNRPADIRRLHRQITHKTGDPHQAEHRMMECLEQVLRQAQHSAEPPDERAYLKCLEALARRG